MFFKSKPLTQADIQKALDAIVHPVHGQNLVALGMVSGIVLKEKDKGTSVTFVVDIKDGDQQLMEQLRAAAEKTVKSLRGVTEARAIFTASNTASHAVSSVAPAKAAKPHGKTAMDVKQLGKIIAGWENPLLPQILPLLWHKKDCALVCWMPMCMGHLCRVYLV
jgi:metal-sulfur cluster biosynthetic enzyme